MATSKSTKYDNKTVTLSETFSPDSTGSTKTSSDVSVIRMLEENIQVISNQGALFSEFNKSDLIVLSRILLQLIFWSLNSLKSISGNIFIW